MTDEPITIDNLRNLGAEPSWFGLGFIQLKADKKNRFHFWHPDLAPDAPEFSDEWHDHRYDFTSRVIRGSLITETAKIIHLKKPDDLPPPVKAALLEEVCCAGGATETKGYCTVIPRTKFTTMEGSEYFLHRDVFHRVAPGGDGRVATLQTRDIEVKQKARVVRPHDAMMTNPFDSQMPTDYLWDVIADVLRPSAREKNPGYHLCKIPKGELGEVSKIAEELAELIDADVQESRVMQLVELSDMMGAMQAFLDRHHGGYTLADLTAFSRITERAFQNGHRS